MTGPGPDELDGRRNDVLGELVVLVRLGGVDVLLMLGRRRSNRLGFLRTCFSVGRDPECSSSLALESSYVTRMGESNDSPPLMTARGAMLKKSGPR